MHKPGLMDNIPCMLLLVEDTTSTLLRVWEKRCIGFYSPGSSFYMVLQPNCLLYSCHLASLTGTQVKHRARAPT